MGQGAPLVEKYIHSGITIPQHNSELKAYWQNGQNYGVGFGRPITNTLSGILNIELSILKLDSKQYFSTLDWVNGEIWGSAQPTKIVTLMIGLKQRLIEKGGFRPYLTAEAGFMRILPGWINWHNEQYRQGLKAAAEISTGAGFGCGVDFGLSRVVSFFIQLNYDIGFTDYSNTVYVPVKVGFLFN